MSWTEESVNEAIEDLSDDARAIFTTLINEEIIGAHYIDIDDALPTMVMSSSVNDIEQNRDGRIDSAIAELQTSGLVEHKDARRIYIPSEVANKVDDDKYGRGSHLDDDINIYDDGNI